eukprot:333300_1
MHFVYFNVFVVIFYQAYQCYSAFTIGNNSLPRRSDALSIGYDNETNTILLFGGVGTERQFIKFKNNQFTDMTATYLTTSTQSTGQHYTQIGHTLWMIDTKGKNLFSIDTQTYVEDSSSVSIPTSTTARGCLASHQHYLFVVAGGDPATNILQIYNISDGEWVINAPNLNHVRRGISCIVSGSSLFAIGGYTGSDALDSIEVLDLTDVPQIQAKAWQYFGDTLTKTLDATRSVLYGNDILVIGGYTSPTSPDPCTDVHIILTETEECVLWDTLQTAVSLASSIIIYDTLYVFGGAKQSGAGSNNYQYKVLPPTAGKTSSINPTMTPTSIPTYNPTIAPTLNPTNVPTLPPSRHPTSIPTTNPTVLSTLSPSDDDTLVPTHHSTSFPTANSASISTVYSTSPLITDTTNAIVLSSIPSVSAPIATRSYGEGERRDATIATSLPPMGIHMNKTKADNPLFIGVGVIAGTATVLVIIIIYVVRRNKLKRKTQVIDAIIVPQDHDQKNDAADDAKDEQTVRADESRISMHNKKESIESLYRNQKQITTDGGSTVTGKEPITVNDVEIEGIPDDGHVAEVEMRFTNEGPHEQMDGAMAAGEGNEDVNIEGYERIQSLLIECKVKNWKECLQTFIDMEMTDEALGCVPKDHVIWEALLTKCTMGSRFLFKDKWFKQTKQ